MPSYTQSLNLYLPSPLDDLDIHPPLAQNFQNIEDKLGNLVVNTGTVTYTYNDDNTVNTITTPNKTYTYFYVDGVIDYVEESDGGETIRTTYTFDDKGRLQTVVREVV